MKKKYITGLLAFALHSPNQRSGDNDSCNVGFIQLEDSSRIPKLEFNMRHFSSDAQAELSLNSCSARRENRSNCRVDTFLDSVKEELFEMIDGVCNAEGENDFANCRFLLLEVTTNCDHCNLDGEPSSCNSQKVLWSTAITRNKVNTDVDFKSNIQEELLSLLSDDSEGGWPLT